MTADKDTEIHSLHFCFYVFGFWKAETIILFQDK